MLEFYKSFFAFTVLSAALVFVNAPKHFSQTEHSAAAAEIIEKAAALLENNDLSEARILLKAALLKEPRNVAALTLAGVAADRQNDLAAAEKHFALAVRHAPDSAEARNNYGAILLRLKRPVEAAREFSAALAINPNQPSALINLAQIKLDANDLTAARQLFERAKATQPDAEILRSLLVISLQKSETARAEIEFGEYFALAAQSKDRAARLETGRLLLERNLNRAAAQELAAALALDASNVETLVLLSQAFLSEKDVRAAGKLLESAIANGADDAKIYAALAEVYKTGGYLENAIPAMRRAIEKEPDNEFLRARYGLLLVDSRAPAAAVARLEQAVKEFPASARLWLALGIAQQIGGAMLEAQKSFEKSLQLEPQSIPATAYLASSFVERANYAEAAALYERALKFDEKNATLHYLLADTLLKVADGDEKSIEKHLTRAVQLNPKSSFAHLALGKLFARRESWQSAAAEFEAAARYAPDSAEAFYQLGRALARLKRSDEARAAFDKSKKLGESLTAAKETTRQELVRRLANVRF